MSQYIDGIEFVTLHCCNCGIPFAMTADFTQRRRNDHKYFHCPAGHEQHFTGKSEAQKLRDELDAANRRLSNAINQANNAERERVQANKAHKKMRTRIANGVCPCCNRTFQNLMSHMRTEHPEFGKPESLRTLRDAFGMTQGMVAEEAGVGLPYVSLFERGKRVPEYAKTALENWMDSAGGVKA